MDHAAKSLVLNGLLQSDLDCNFYQLKNLNTENLPFGQSPPTIVPIPKFFLTGWNQDTQLWSRSQPNILEISGFPGVSGQAGKFLSNNGSGLLWSTTISAAAGDFINVKKSPYNATGDGVTDDYGAIQQAINDNPGKTIYFPPGTYRLGQNLVSIQPISLLGENSTLLGDVKVHGAILTLSGFSIISRMIINGDLTTILGPPVAVDRDGIVGSGPVIIHACQFRNLARHGIWLNNAPGSVVTLSGVDNCGSDGIRLESSPGSWVLSNKISRAIDRGIYLLHSPLSFVKANWVKSCAVNLFGVTAADSDDTAIEENTIEQCAFGLEAFTTAGRGKQSYGMNISGNNISRNYIGGSKITLSNGFMFGNNILSNNGQGGVDDATYTMEPGITIDPSNPGINYQIGDFLTLSGGTGVAGKVLVTKTDLSGHITFDGLVPITLGIYSVFPANPVTVTGGHGTGAKVILTSSRISSGGGGYEVGDMLRGANGSFVAPVRLLVTGVTAGIVKDYEVIDGGGYIGVSLPLLLVFTNDTGAGSGLSIVASWGKRYSAHFDGETPFGLCTLGAIFGGIVGGNIISETNAGPGVLVQEASAPYNERASYLCVTGNSLMNNDAPFNGQTVGDPLDDDYNFNSIFDNNIIYP